MNQKKSWTKYEDQLLNQTVANYQFCIDKKIRWNQIQKKLKFRNADWNRSGKQCRQRQQIFQSFRWLNCQSVKSQQLSQSQIQRFLQLLRDLGKSWSLIAKKFVNKNANTFKNFFYSGLRKGLRNLNIYNNVLRTQKIYKTYKYDFINKILSVHDKKKSQCLMIANEQAYQLAADIRQKLIVNSLKDIKSEAWPSIQLQRSYEQLNDKIFRFSKLCRYKKLSNAKSFQSKKEDQKFTMKINKKQSKSSKLLQQSNEEQISQKFCIKLQQLCKREDEKMNEQQEPMMTKVTSPYEKKQDDLNEYLNRLQEIRIQPRIQLEMILLNEEKGENKNLFQVLIQQKNEKQTLNYFV